MSASFEEALQDGNMACQTTKSFTEHESMAYGADWLVCPHPTQNGYFEAAVRYVASKHASGVNIFLSLSFFGLHTQNAHRFLIDFLMLPYSCSFYDRAVYLWDSVF